MTMEPGVMPSEQDTEIQLGREWLVTNGLGGYASGTISGACTRRYHGLLIAALPAPLGRFVMLNHLGEELKWDDRRVMRLGMEELSDQRLDQTTGLQGDFRLEKGLPVWRYEVGQLVLEKRVLLPYLQNTVYVSYHLLSAPGHIRLRLRPSFHFRPHEAPVKSEFAKPYTVTGVRDYFEVRSEIAPPLRVRVVGPRSSLVLDGGHFRQVQYRVEQSRGYDHDGSLWCPGYFRADLEPGQVTTLVASTEDWETVSAVKPRQAWEAEVERRDRLIVQAHPSARSGLGAELVLAADQFLIRPTTRVADTAAAHAAGDEVRTVIAGYHWFTDWGRDTMISLEGLTLTTGRQVEAGYILRTFGRYVRDGLIPNLFPEGQREGLYHTADATLWFFHALDRYLKASGDQLTLKQLLPTLRSIIDHHVRGTRFGIQVDPDDGLLRQGAEGYQLTWMDAKVEDWVVTPRRGKAVEINALWYNALRLMERWSHETGDAEAAAGLAGRAQQAYRSFNERFWYEEGNYLYDIVDGEHGDDPALRPNQLFAISLDYPVLDPSRWKTIVSKATEHLLTPVGLRSLAPNHPDYKATYDGDLRSRDAAYHQGTVWGWLIGPYIDACLRAYPNEIDSVHRLLEGFRPHLEEGGCLGSVNEIFDAEPPFHPRGCIAQAWSVAEVLRCWVKTAVLQQRQQNEG